MNNESQRNNVIRTGIGAELRDEHGNSVAPVYQQLDDGRVIGTLALRTNSAGILDSQDMGGYGTRTSDSDEITWTPNAAYEPIP